jgi:hypothetical protein
VLSYIRRVAPTVARNIHRVSSSAADLLPAAIVSRLNQLPGADLILIGPRTSRVLIDVQHPDRPRDARIDVLTARTVAEALADEVALSFLKGNQAAQARSHFESAHGEAAQLSQAIEAGQIDAAPERFCPPPPAPRAVAHQGTVRFRGVEANHISFSSDFQVPAGLPGADRWDACRANHSVHAYVLEHDDAAPWLVNVHGVKQGDPTDMFLFRSGMHRERYGVNVVHPVLPMSGPRTDRHSPQLPGVDLSTNVIGLAQATWDVRRTLRWIRQRSDAPIILHGVSLGSYVAALVAGLDDDPVAVIAGLPVVDYPGLIRRHARRMDLPESDLELVDDPAIDRLYSSVSPLNVVPRLPVERRYIYAGKLDQISSAHQALTLWNHWDMPSMYWFDGGHLGGALWDRGVKRYVDAAIADTVEGQLALA